MFFLSRFVIKKRGTSLVKSPVVVLGVGLEPTQPQWPRDFKSLVSTDSTIRAAVSCRPTNCVSQKLRCKDNSIFWLLQKNNAFLRHKKIKRLRDIIVVAEPLVVSKP